jgi:hypothetical protein
VFHFQFQRTGFVLSDGAWCKFMDRCGMQRFVALRKGRWQWESTIVEPSRILSNRMKLYRMCRSANLVNIHVCHGRAPNLFLPHCRK